MLPEVFWGWLYFGFLLYTIFIILMAIGMKFDKIFWRLIAAWWLFNLSMVFLFHV